MSLGSIKSALGSPFTVMGSATRHVMDTDLAFGVLGQRWNERDEYRNSYTPQQRAGAGVGNVLGAALPVAAGVAWKQYGWRVPTGFTPSVAGGRMAGTAAGAAAGALIGNSIGDMLGNDQVSRYGGYVGAGVGAAAGFGMGGAHGVQTVGVAALAAMTAVGIKKTVQTVQDDGNLASVGAVGIGLGAAIAGYKAGGKWGPLAGLGAGIAGAIGGHYAGKLVKVGPGHVGTGEHVPSESNVHTDGIGRVDDYARGAFTHFIESGPISQGVSFGYTWKQQQHFREDYPQPEQGGAIAGDLAAATILGGGAIGLTRALTSTKGVVAGGTFSKIAFESTAGSWIAGAATKVGQLHDAKIPLGIVPFAVSGKSAMAAGALALAGGVAAFEGMSEATGNGSILNSLTFGQFDKHVDADSKVLGISTRGLVAGGVTAAAMGATAMIVSGRPVIKAMGGTAAAAGLGAAVLVSALSAARVPVQHIINDVRDLRDQREQSDVKSSVLAGGVGLAAGVAAGAAFGRAMKPGIGTLVGAGVGAVAGGALGYGMSPAMPNFAGTAGAAGAGAVALGVAGLVFTHDVKTAGKAAAYGAAIGTLTSPILTHGAPAKAPVATGDDQQPVRR